MGKGPRVQRASITWSSSLVSLGVIYYVCLLYYYRELLLARIFGRRQAGRPVLLARVVFALGVALELGAVEVDVA